MLQKEIKVYPLAFGGHWLSVPGWHSLPLHLRTPLGHVLFSTACGLDGWSTKMSYQGPMD